MMPQKHNRRTYPGVATKMGENFVNKASLARALDVSETTLNKWIARHGPAFPVVARGSRGLGWRFSPSAVIAFLERVRRTEADVEAASVAGRIQDARLRRLALENRRTESTLVVAAEVGNLFAAAISETRTGVEDFLGQIGREGGWAPAYLAAVHERLDQVFAKACAPVLEAIGPQAAGGTQHTLLAGDQQ